MVAASGAFAQTVVITAPQTVGPTQTTITATAGGPAVPLSTADIWVQGTTLTIDGRHTIASLRVSPIGTTVGRVTHTQAAVYDADPGPGMDFVYGMHLIVSGELRVDLGAEVNANGRGYPAFQGPGAGAWSGAGSCGASGGGYGGRGGDSNCLPAPSSPGGTPYGSPEEPQTLGSGGGRWNNWGGSGDAAGGGAIRIDAASIALDGRITATGTGNPGTSGAGSGGGIRLAAHNIVGSGLLSAAGGNDLATNSSGGAGGGGRIAIYACGLGLPLGSIAVNGGSALGAGGGPGSLLIRVDGVHLTSGPVSTLACVGADIQFEITAAGPGPLAFMWRHDGEPIDTVQIPSAATSTLLLTSVQGLDGGSYDCVVTNACGNLISNPATLTVCVADVDDGSGTGVCDGGVTIDDLLYYLRIFEEGDIRADVDDGSGTGTPDGGVTIDDLLYYLARFEAGC